MNLKVLFIAFLCILSTPIIFNVAMVTFNAMQRSSYKPFSHAVHTGFIITNGTEPTGDPIRDDGWPVI